MWMSAKSSQACAWVAAVSIQWAPSSVTVLLDTSSISEAPNVKVMYVLLSWLPAEGLRDWADEKPGRDPVCLCRSWRSVLVCQDPALGVTAHTQLGAVFVSVTEALSAGWMEPTAWMGWSKEQRRGSVGKMLLSPQDHHSGP